MTPENERTFRLFIRVMAAAVSLLIFGLIIALLEWLGVTDDRTGPLLEWVIFFVAVFTGGAAAKPAGNKIKKALEAIVDDDPEEKHE